MALDGNILNNNLNGTVSYRDYFAAFGYQDGDTIYLRRFDDTKETDEAQSMEIRFEYFDKIIPTLQRYNNERNGIFYVVNGGGQSTKKVKIARAHFADFDDDPFDVQIEKLNAFPLEPSVIVKTKKSLHAYWLLIDGDIGRFEELQLRIIQHFGSDPVIHDPPRVMRLYGFNHCKADPVMVKLIKFNPELKYTQEDLNRVLPPLERKPAKKRGKSNNHIEKDGDIVPIGKRHYYVVSRIGTFINKLADTASDEMIYSLVEADFLEHCEDAESEDLERFHDKYIQTIAKFREQRDAEEKDPDFYKYAVRAWSQENGGKRFDPEVTSWEEAAAAGQRAKEKGIVFNRSSPKAKGRQRRDPGSDQEDLYNLKALQRAIEKGYPVFYVLSKQDADALKSILFYTATTAGSGGWISDYARHFTGAVVTILLSNSAEDGKLADQIIRDLKRYAFEYRTILLPGKSVSEYLTNEGHSPEDLEKVLQAPENGYSLCSWAYVSKSDTVNVNPPQLAAAYSETADYIIVRNPIDDNDLFYGYVNGVYRQWNKAQIKSALRKYVPTVYQKDSQIAEAHRTLFEMGKKIHSFEDLNSDENYINFRNGLYDLRTRELLHHDPEVLSTLQLQYDYDPSAKKMPVFTKYLRDLFTKEDGSIDYDSGKILQEFCGLAISNIYVYRAKKALFLCSFQGNTGKTLVMNLLERILGENNVTSVPIQNMNENTGRFTMGTAIGKRMIINGDQTESDIGDSSYFKQLTGGDRTKMENKNQKPLMVRYRGGIMIGCNGLPSFSDDKGTHIFERILLIMCTNTIPEEKRDAYLIDKMLPEIPAIINWFLAGLHRLKDNEYKFSKSQNADAAIREYRSQLDTVYRFIQEGGYASVYPADVTGLRYVITGNRADQVRKNDFYSSYREWCESPNVDVTPIKKKNLNQRLEALGLEVDRRGTYGEQRGVYTIRGMALIDEVTGTNRLSTQEERETLQKNLSDFSEEETQQKVRNDPSKSPQDSTNAGFTRTPWD